MAETKCDECGRSFCRCNIFYSETGYICSECEIGELAYCMCYAYEDQSEYDIDEKDFKRWEESEEKLSKQIDILKHQKSTTNNPS